MKIMHVIDSGGLYGAEIMLLNLMREQVALGLEPVLASIGDLSCLEKPIEREAARLGLTVRTFRMRPGPNLLGALAILRFGRERRIDLLHSHGYKVNIFFGLMPRVLRRLPLVSTVHGWTWTGGFNRMLFYERLDSLALRGADRVVLVSERMLSHPRLSGLSAETTSVVENGIPALAALDDNDVNPEIAAFTRRGITLCAIGRLSPEKGFGLLLEAMAALVKEGHDLRLVIMGEGGERSRLEAAARELGIEERVLMPGYMPDAKRHLPLFDIFVMPSLTEGLPMVLLEAMQAGVPVAATAVGGIPGVLQQGRCGAVVEPGSKEALVEGLRRVIGNPSESARRAANARQRVTESFSSRTMAQKYLSIYGSLI